MLGPAGYVLAILGCGEADAPCEPVSLPPVRFVSESECQGSTEEALARHADLPYPVIVAECRRIDAAPAVINANEVARPEPRGLLSRFRIASAG